MKDVQQHIPGLFFFFPFLMFTSIDQRGQALSHISLYPASDILECSCILSRAGVRVCDFVPYVFQHALECELQLSEVSLVVAAQEYISLFRER